MSNIFINNHGDKFYYLNGKFHREDGPAIEYADGGKLYYYNGEFLFNIKSQKAFKRYLKLMIFK